LPRLYLPSIPKGKRIVRIAGDEARYLMRVLRMKAGDELSVFDSAGAHFRAIIREAGRNGVVAELAEALPPAGEPARPLVLLQGVLKGEKMDFVVQKAAELGVSEVVPLITERSQVRETRKGDRWRKIAVEASRQSFRTSVAGIREPVAFEDFFAGRSSAEGFIFWEEGGARLRGARLSPSSKPLVVAVGPEGGFTPREVELARAKGLEVKTLGKRILRAETAALAAVSIVQFMLGEMG